MMASLQICGTVPVLHPSLNSCSNFFLHFGPRCINISLVILSGPGDFFSGRNLSASSSSSVMKGLSIPGSIVKSLLFSWAWRTSLCLSVVTCRSLIEEYWSMKAFAHSRPEISFPSFSSVIGELLLFSSFRLRARLHSLWQSLSRFSSDVFFCHELRELPGCRFECA